jgi:glycosyltransferase involved in cell wall biosynthesis
MKPGCSLIISTYNWPQALDLCLKSVLIQSRMPEEVIIADDGSKDDTRQLIKTYQEKFPVPLVHVWQPDEGFQLSRIRNKAIAQAKEEYIIQIDGDLILHPQFINDHVGLSQPGYFVTGSRLILSPQTTKHLIHTSQTSINFAIHLKSRNFFNALRIGVLRRFLANRYKVHGSAHKYYVKGCNMAFWKKDLLMVNGYNEDYVGWGKEDSEIAVRLINSGVNKKFIKMGGIAYHLYHKEAERNMDEAHTRMMFETIENNVKLSAKGINQYL